MVRRTGFREQYYTGTRNFYSAGKIGASNQTKLYINLGWFFIDNFGFINSFGLALFVERDMIILHDWELIRSLGKSICKRLSETKVILHMIKLKKFSIWRRFRDPKDLSGAQDRALTRNGFYTWLEELASESNTIQAQGIISQPGRLELQTM